MPPEISHLLPVGAADLVSLAVQGIRVTKPVSDKTHNEPWLLCLRYASHLAGESRGMGTLALARRSFMSWVRWCTYLNTKRIFMLG